jgi:hypothetical protein
MELDLEETFVGFLVKASRIQEVMHSYHLAPILSLSASMVKTPLKRI